MPHRSTTLLTTLLAAAALSGCVPVVASHASHPVIAEAPPALDNTRGKVVLVGFSATYCDPCKRSLEKYRELAQRFGQELVVIAVSVDDHGTADPDLGFPMVFDKDGKARKFFGPGTLNTSYVLDQSGHVRHVHPTFESGDEETLASEIGALLEQGSAEEKLQHRP